MSQRYHNRPQRWAGRVHYPDCWLANHGHMEGGEEMPACDGSLVRVHLIPRQLLKRERLPQLHPGTYVYACGGPMGNAGHHGLLDSSRRLRVRFEDLPVKTREFAEQHGLTYWLEREYGRC